MNPSAIIFGVVALVALLAGIEEVVRAAQLHDALRAILAGLFFVAGAASAYEAFVLEEHAPTISQSAIQAFIHYPGLWLASLVLVMAFLGLLAYHFTGSARVLGLRTGLYVVLLATVALWAGAAISWVTGWLARLPFSL